MREMARMEALGQRIRTARLRQGLTQLELATDAGLMASQVSLLENGERVPGLFAMLRLFGALGLEVEELACLPPHPDVEEVV
jgi:transcriptional regulator with XRE-family HTH domain